MTAVAQVGAATGAWGSQAPVAHAERVDLDSGSEPESVERPGARGTGRRRAGKGRAVRALHVLLGAVVGTAVMPFVTVAYGTLAFGPLRSFVYQNHVIVALFLFPVIALVVAFRFTKRPHRWLVGSCLALAAYFVIDQSVLRSLYHTSWLTVIASARMLIVLAISCGVGRLVVEHLRGEAQA